MRRGGYGRSHVPEQGDDWPYLSGVPRYQDRPDSEDPMAMDSRSVSETIPATVLVRALP